MAGAGRSMGNFPGPKIKKSGGAKEHLPKFGPIWGQLPIFEKFKIFEFGVSCPFWILVIAPFRLQQTLLVL